MAAVKSVSGGTFAGLYDAISLPEQSYKYTIPIVEKLGGGIMPVVLGAPEKDVPSSVKVARVFGISELTHGICKSYIQQCKCKVKWFD